MSARPARDDIAIVGMSGLFAKAANISELWSNILAKVDAISEADDEWLGDEALFSPDSSREEMRIYTKRGGFLNELARFDPRSFGTMPISVIGGEPDQFLALKGATDALVDAGYADGNFDSHRTGIILGHAIHANRANVNGIQQGLVLTQTLGLLRALCPDVGPDRLSEIEAIMRAKLPKLNVDAAPGLVPNMMTGRIANRLDLMAPNYIMDAACASSLLAIDAAMAELRAGRADLMLAGGVNTTISTLVVNVFCQIEALSRTSTIRPFDRSANGTLLGEGLGVVVLKRLGDALRDGDRIYAIVKAIGASSDGRAVGLMAPRLEGEILAIRRAYESAGIEPSSVELIEAHGTGIPLGDQIEIEALRSVFGEAGSAVPGIALGSVKSMIGHCIPAAGVASVIKASLALHHKVLPPTLLDEVSPDLGLEGTPFYLNTEARPWIRRPSMPRRAAINAFGFGGINSHMILEEPPGQGGEVEPTAAFGMRSSRSHLVVLRAPDRESLLAKLQDLVERTDWSDARTLRAVSHSQLKAQEDGDCRLAIVADSSADLQAKLGQAIQALAEPSVTQFRRRKGIYYASVPVDGRVVFLFPGENSQYPNMLRDLAIRFPVVRRWFDALDELFAGERELSHGTLLYPPPTCLTDDQRQRLGEVLLQVDSGSECVFYADMALFSLLTALGVRADFMAGHSTGENAALVASGTAALDQDEAGRFIRRMNRIYLDLQTKESIPSGSLLTVGALPRQRVDEALSRYPDLHFTMDNCPNQAILFGSDERIAAVAAELSEQGAICDRLPLSWAYHTAFVSPMESAFRELFREVRIGKPRARLYSCVTATPFPKTNEAIRRRACKQYVSRVRFTDLIRRLHDDGARIFIEVGPNNILTSFVRDTLGKRPHLAVAMDDPRRDGLTQFLNLLGQLFVQGLPIRLDALSADDPAAQTASAGPVLKTSVPFIKLDDDEAARVRRLLALDRARDSEASVESHAPPIRTAPAPATGRPPRAAGNGLPAPRRVPAMREHFALMQRFLQHQETVARAAVGRTRTRRDYQISDIGRLFPTPDRVIVKKAVWLEDALDDAALARHARRLLSADEAKYWRDALAGRTQDRQAQWLLGRIAAKAAVSDWLAAQGAEVPSPSEIGILNDDSGMPRCVFDSQSDAGGEFHLSISHKLHIAVAAVSEGRVGIDLERIGRETNLHAAEGIAFNEDERKLIHTCSSKDGFVYAWSAKEAAAKFRGQALLGEQLAYRLLDLDMGQGQCRVTYPGDEIKVKFAHADEFVYAIAHERIGG